MHVLTCAHLSIMFTNTVALAGSLLTGRVTIPKNVRLRRKRSPCSLPADNLLYLMRSTAWKMLDMGIVASAGALLPKSV